MFKNKKPHPNEPPNPDSNIREIIFGAEDGFVSTLGLVLGMASATNDSRIVIIAGLVYIIAEAFSMAAGTYLSSKAQKEFYMSELHREKREIDELPDVEKAEVYDLYRNKGFRGKALRTIVKQITSRKDVWLRVMLEEELHVFPAKINPIKDSLAMFFASLFSGIIPVFPFLFLSPSAAIIGSILLTLMALFMTGVAKGFYVKSHWIRSGLEMLIIGAVAAAIGYGVGIITGGMVH